jgi:hypothetical protein
MKTIREEMLSVWRERITKELACNIRRSRGKVKKKKRQIEASRDTGIVVL